MREKKIQQINKILGVLLFFVVFFANSLCFAEDENKLMRVELIYKVPESILLSQNKDENIQEGQKEFETYLKGKYSKRFDIRKIERQKFEETHTPAEYLQKVQPLETPLLVIINLEGTGTSVDHYQNAFGAKVDGVAPSVFVRVKEIVIDRKTGTYDGMDYGRQEYTAGTIAWGRDVYAVNTNPRTNVKNAVKAAINDVCRIDKSINKYANPTKYQKEIDRYYGRFEKINKAEKQEALEKEQKEAPDRARVAKFLEWAKKQPGLEMVVNMVKNNGTEFGLQTIEMYKAMGLYVEK